jgi:hypothetical protein
VLSLEEPDERLRNRSHELLSSIDSQLQVSKESRAQEYESRLPESTLPGNCESIAEAVSERESAGWIRGLKK